MVLCRCEKLHSWPKGKKKDYIAFVEPVGYPNTSIICGLTGCHNPAVIWIEEEDVHEYNKGRRIFTVPTLSVKVKASDKGIVNKQ